MTHYEQPSVIIPTAKHRVATLDSVPDYVDAHVVREGNRAKARNIGARRADGDILVFADDDIAFGPDTFWSVVHDCERGTVQGLRDYDFGLLLTRLLVVHRDDWRLVGGFDARLDHMEDTEWCLRAQASGLSLRRLPRGTVEHEAHQNDIGTPDRVRALAQVARRHPWQAPRLISQVIT